MYGLSPLLTTAHISAYFGACHQFIEMDAAIQLYHDDDLPSPELVPQAII